MRSFCADVAKLANAAVFKTADPGTVLWVRVPPSAFRTTIAPVVVRATTRAKIRATGAERTLQFDYTAFGLRDQERSHYDLPQLPERMQTQRA